MSILIVGLLLAIVVSLGQALASMSGGSQGSLRTVRALTVRITLSVALFALLFVGYHYGWIEPHGMQVGRH